MAASRLLRASVWVGSQAVTDAVDMLQQEGPNLANARAEREAYVAGYRLWWNSGNAPE